MEYTGLSDDDSTNDNASVTSSMSGSIVYEDTRKCSHSNKIVWELFLELLFSNACFFTDLGEDLTDQIQEIDVFEGKLEEAIEGMYEKSVQIRISNIEFVTAALMKRFVPEFVIRRLVLIMLLLLKLT